MPTDRVSVAAATTLAARIDAVLPQTQCTRCGFPDCRSYADAIAAAQAPIDRCPPGGAEGVRRLARVTGRPERPLDEAHGVEAPRRLALIDEQACIGCTLCIKACPVDCIVGASKRMHTVIAALCTGCELCLPVCPVDCIGLVPASGAATGWAAWSTAQADEARARHARRRERVAREAAVGDDRLAQRVADPLGPNGAAATDATAGAADDAAAATRRGVVDAALARARQRVQTAAAPAAAADKPSPR